METKTKLYTDGACLGNPGAGGWASILYFKSHKKILCGNEADTTNNRMELTAVIKGLSALTRPVNVTIITDSKYVMNGIDKWIANWKKNNWKTSNKKVVKNKDLWLQLDSLCEIHQVDWQWIKGHSGHAENEECDHLAQEEAKKIQTAAST